MFGGKIQTIMLPMYQVPSSQGGALCKTCMAALQCSNFKDCGNLREHSQSVVLCKPCLDKKRCVRDGCNEKQMSGNRTLCMNHWRSENSKCKGKNGACMAACHNPRTQGHCAPCYKKLPCVVEGCPDTRVLGGNKCRFHRNNR